MPSELAAVMYEAAANAIRAVPDAERADTYVVSFFVYDHEDDPRLPTVTFGTNTESQVRLAVDPPADFEKPNPWWTPVEPDEARWNYAFWQQNALGAFGDPGRDEQSAAAVERWIRDSGLWLEEPEDDDGWDAFDTAGSTITRAFADVCAQTARRLHDDGVIVEVFGRPIPIVIHELEYYDAIADETAAANPPGLADGFIDWVHDQ